MLELGVRTGCDSKIPESNTFEDDLKDGSEEGTASVGAEPLIGEAGEGISSEEAGGIKRQGGSRKEFQAYGDVFQISTHNVATTTSLKFEKSKTKGRPKAECLTSGHF